MPRLDEESYRKLRDSISKFGMLTPVIYSAGPVFPGKIVDGFHRLKIAKELGITPPRVDLPFESEAAFRVAQVSVNVERRQLSIAQRVQILEANKEWVSALAREALGQRGKSTATLAVESGLVSKMFDVKQRRGSLPVLAHLAGTSETNYVSTADALRRADPETKEKLLHGEISTNAAIQKIKRATFNEQQPSPTGQREKNADERAKLRELLGPMGPFNLLVIDAPWNTYDRHADTVITAQLTTKLPIHDNDVMAADSVVAIVTPFRHIRATLEIFERWGYAAPAAMVWVKPTGAPTTEYVVFAGKGACASTQSDLADGFVLGSSSGDSRLPAQLYDRLMLVEGKRLVLWDNAPARWGIGVWGEAAHATAAVLQTAAS